jgi:hypothetical protein
LKDGTKLVTLADARAFILNEPKHIQGRNSWQRAAELMIQASSAALVRVCAHWRDPFFRFGGFRPYPRGRPIWISP